MKALPEAFPEPSSDDFVWDDAPLVYPALGQALNWLASNAVETRWTWPRRETRVKANSEAAVRRFWAFIETALDEAPGDHELRNLIELECFEHDAWHQSSTFMGARTRELRGDARASPSKRQSSKSSG